MSGSRLASGVRRLVCGPRPVSGGRRPVSEVRRPTSGPRPVEREVAGVGAWKAVGTWSAEVLLQLSTSSSMGPLLRSAGVSFEKSGQSFFILT